MKKVKGLKSTDWQLQNSRGDVQYSTGDIVTNLVINMCGARWALDLSGVDFIGYINV